MVIKVLLTLNLIFLDIGLIYLLFKPQAPVVAPTSTNNIQYVDQCGTECQKYIDSKIVIPTPTTLTKTIYQTTPKTKTRSVIYVPIPGSGFTTSNTWSDLSGTDFYFDKNDYPGLIDVVFESNLRLFNGNGKAFVQIYDVTHGVGVQGSDVSTTSQTSTAVISGKVTFWSGKNLYRIQAKSLTADTAMFDGGRLKITLEQ